MGVLSSEIRTAVFRNRYGAAFDAFLKSPGEQTLRAAYELGREAIEKGLAVLELAAVHHDVLAGALHDADAEAAERITTAAGDFLVESLSAFEMLQRANREARERAVVEQRHASILRQLSNLLSDASLTAGTSESLSEILQLVAEQARELTQAASCVARARMSPDHPWIEASAHADVDTWSDLRQPDASSATEARDRLSVPLLSLAGTEIGTLEIAKSEGDLNELDEAILVHVAQMTAATIERARLYHR